MGGIWVEGLQSVEICVDGVLLFSDELKAWPRDGSGHVHECMYFRNCTNITFTSSSSGVVDGNGERWWGIPGIGYLVREENRPRLLHIEDSRGVLVERLLLRNSPYWTFWASNVDGLEVRFTNISARRTTYNGHDVIDLT